MTVKALHRAAVLALSIAFAGTLIAQSATQQPPPQPTPTQPPATAQQPPRPTTQPPATTTQRTPAAQGELRSMDGQTVTLSGCLMREADVPGATPNIAERAGIAPDFILTNVQMRSASPSGATTAPPATSPSAPSAGAAGASNLKVKLTKVDNDKVREHLNKLVEVTGRLDADGSAAGARPGTPGTTTSGTTPPGTATGAQRTANTELAELEVSAIKVVGQSCSAQQ